MIGRYRIFNFKNGVSYNLRFFIIFCLFFFLLIVNSSAFGVGTLYSEGYPLKLTPGESKEVSFFIRNLVEGDSDVIVNAEIIKGNEIASFSDKKAEYNVPSGEEVEANVFVKVPSSVKIGNRYEIAAIFRPSTISSDSKKGVQLVFNLGKSFPVVIVKNKKSITGMVGGNEDARLTVEEGQQDLWGGLAPSEGSKGGIWWGVVIFMLVLIFILLLMVVLLIVYFIRQKNQRIIIGQNMFSPQNSTGPSEIASYSVGGM